MRFPEFGGEWNKQVLMGLMEFKVTNSFSRENLNYENGTVKNIHYGDIHTKFQTLFDITKEVVPYINEDISIDRISGDFYCKEGDIVFADASEDLNDVGKSIEIANLDNEKLLSGLHTLLARPNKNYFHKGFNGYLFKSNSVRFQIQKEAQGTKVLSISAKRISNIKLSFPSILEQEKITGLLTLADERISTQNKIIDNLETLIKGLCQKLFTQKLRFKDDNEKTFPDWVTKKGKDIFNSHSNKKHNGDLPILSASQELGMVFRDENGIQIQSSVSSVKSYKIVEKGDFVISLRSFQGGIEYSKLHGICSPAYTILKPKIEVNSLYFKYYFKNETFIERLSKTVVGIRDGKQISYDAFGGLKHKVPPVNEQTKIANFISSISKKIESEKQLLREYENQKKYLLQNMFI